MIKEKGQVVKVTFKPKDKKLVIAFAKLKKFDSTASFMRRAAFNYISRNTTKPMRRIHED